MKYLIFAILFSVNSTAHSTTGAKLSKNDIKFLITLEANRQGIDPQLAIAVAEVESNLNPNAVGSKGEIGLFQLMPTLKAQLVRKDTVKQIEMAIKQLKYWKQFCPMIEGVTFIICYNNGLRHPKYPFLHPYYKKVMAIYDR